MNRLTRIVFADDSAPAGALEDVLGMAALSLMVLAIFAVTSLA